MSKKLFFAAGAGVGYVLGTKAGRQKYEEIVAKARDVLDRPAVKEVTDAVRAEAERLYAEGRQKLRERTGNPADDEVAPVPPPAYVPPTLTTSGPVDLR